MLQISIGILAQTVEGRSYGPDDDAVIADCEQMLLSAIRAGMHKDLAQIHENFATGRAQLHSALNVLWGYLSTNAEDTAHTVGKTAHAIQAERKSVEARWLAQASDEEIAAFKRRKSDPRYEPMRRSARQRTISATDLPTKADILHVLESVFPELVSMVPDPTSSPKEHAAMWKAAGLSHARQAKGAPLHRNIAARIVELQEMRSRGRI
jgi:hypothetical protein